MVDYLPSMREALVLIPNTTTKNENKNLGMQ
jgi:hypothetical protein